MGLRWRCLSLMCFPWLIEVAREEEFAPVKNAPLATTDSPDTARILISQQSLRWLVAVNATFVNEEGDVIPVNTLLDGSNENIGKYLCEISPQLSCHGENLESFANEKVVLPCYLS